MTLGKFHISQLIIYVDSLEIVASSNELKIKLYELNELVKNDENTARYDVDYIFDYVEDFLGMRNMKIIVIDVIKQFDALSEVGKASALYLQKNI